MQKDRPAFRRLSDLRISHKLILLVSITTLSLLALSVFVSQSYREELLAARQHEISSIVEIVTNQIQTLPLNAEERRGENPPDSVRNLVLSARYRQHENIFLLHSNGTILINSANSNLEGLTIDKPKDQAGNSILLPQLQETLRLGQSYWRYPWDKRTNSLQLHATQEKLSYVKVIPQTDWLLGAGIFVSDLENHYNKQLLLLAIITLMIICVALLLSILIARDTSEPLVRLARTTAQLRNDDLTAEVADTDRQDEIGTLARMLETLKEQALENRRLRKLSEHARFLEEFDPQTRLFNRQTMAENISREIHRERPLALILISLPILKEIAHQYSREKTSETLQLLIEHLNDALQAGDLLGRYGDDSLILLHPLNSEPNTLKSYISSLLEALYQPVQVDQHRLSCIPHLGISRYPEDAEQEFHLVGCAEEALKHARQTEQPAVRYDQLDSASINHDIQLWHDLQHALQTDQFFLVFQPIYDAQTGSINAAEVLLRWQHPERGFISPAIFIPLAERAGLIKQIDEWVLRAVARQYQQWQTASFALPRLSVNLSGLSFMRSDLAPLLQKTFAHNPEQLQQITLELTEGMLIEDMSKVGAQIRRLRKLGCKLSIDDFGTGYSSLSRIRHLELDHLKIDRSFIQTLDENTHDALIVNAILQMAKGFNLKVVAEGVETESQKQQLQNLGCDYLQGFLLSKPIEAKAFMQLCQHAQL